MIRVIPMKKIKGVVFLDSNNNNTKDSSENVLKGIKVNLFKVHETHTEKNYNDGKNIRLRKEKLVLKTKTNERGEYSFLVAEGKYSVSVDIDSLPPGKGVSDPSILVDFDSSKSVDFPVKDINSIEVGSYTKEIVPGQSFVLNPVAKDKKGKELAARLEYFCDSSCVEFDSNCFTVKPVHPVKENITVKVSAGSLSKELPLSFKPIDKMPIEEVRAACERGVLDEKTKIIHYFNLLFKDKKTTSRRPPTPIKSGSSAVKEIQDYIRKKDADKNIVEEAKRYISTAIPELDKAYTSPSGYFKIHYTTKGTHAVPDADIVSKEVPVYIKKIAESLEYVKKTICDSRGFREPILEYNKDFLDVYVYDLEGKYGIAFPTEYYDMTATKQRRASCSISIDNNYSPSKGFKDHRDNCMKVTAAHEFFHAVQYAYNVDADSWWKEASATWVEDEIYDDINDYTRYIDRVFDSPEKSLEQSSYGGVVFVKYLSEKLGGYNLIKRIWEIQGTTYDTSIKAIDRAIREKYNNKNIGTAFEDYAAFNFNPPQYYSEGAFWKKTVAIENTFTDFPVSPKNGILDHLASNYHLFKIDKLEKGKALRIVVNNHKNVNWAYKIQRRKITDNLCSTTEINLDPYEDRAEIILEDFGSIYDEICLIPVNLEKYTDKIPYMFSASVE